MMPMIFNWKPCLGIFSLILFSQSLHSQNLYFPPVTGNVWETTSPASLGWCEEHLPELYDYLEDANSKGFIVLKDGRIVLEKYFGTFTKDSLWYWASAGKSLTSFLVGIAQQEGKLSIEDPSSKYLGTGWTDCTAQDEARIKVRHQLTMTTGLDDGVPNVDCTDKDCLKCLAEPGKRWAYHNAAYTLLDKVIESATGANLNSFVLSKLSTQTGIYGSFLPIDYNNVFFSKPRVMARFGLLMLNRGNWNGNQILKDMDYYQKMITSSQDLNKSYGYLWWLNGKASFMAPGLQFVFPGFLTPNAPADMFSALGKNGQIIHVVPSQNLVVVRIGNAPGTGAVPITLPDTIWQKLNKVMCLPSATDESATQYLNAVKINQQADHITVMWDEKQFDLKLINAAGEMLLQKNSVRSEVQINVHWINTGIYYIRLQDTNGRTVVKKVMIQ